MAGGREYSKTQKKIIDRYYENQDTIVAQRLGEIVTELFLAIGNEKKTNQLWTRAEKALARSGLNKARIAQVLKDRDLEGLGRLAGEASK
ncbi:MAG: hypothetical protein ACIARR_05685 [Phycisphaerales bacterium JB059]|jgi:hypothetical protein